MSVARKALRFLLIFLVAFIFVSLTPSFLHRREYDQAFTAYYRNPTPENSAALRAQQRINDYIKFSFTGVSALALTTCGYGIYGVIRLVSRSVKRARTSKNQL
jgi:hypothetical protein